MTDLKRDLDALRIEREPERRGLGRWIIWTGLIVVLAALGFGGWRWITRERPIEVQVTTVTVRPAGTQAAVLNASGYVTARRRATGPFVRTALRAAARRAGPPRSLAERCACAASAR